MRRNVPTIVGIILIFVALVSVFAISTVNISGGKETSVVGKHFSYSQNFTSELNESYKLLEQLNETGVRVVFTNNEALNCGAASSSSGVGGCFHHSTPNTIYISPKTTDVMLKYLVYHEYAHVLQYHEGAEGDECAADKQALEWGANIQYSGYYECELINYYDVLKVAHKTTHKK